MSAYVPKTIDDADGAVKDAPVAKRRKPFHRGKRGAPSFNRRSDDHRRKVSEAFVQKMDEERAKNIPARFVPVPDLTSSESISKNCAQVPVSTRGVGTAVAASYSAAKAKYGDKVTRICTPLQAYRCALLQATYCLQRAEETKPYAALEPLAHESVFIPTEVASVVSSTTDTLNLVSVVLNGIGCFEESKGTFWTVVPGVTSNSSIVYHYTAMNFATVIASASANRTSAVREAFYNTCSIPGAVFDVNHRLSNGPLVCPTGWPDRNQVLADFQSYTALISFLRGKMPHLVGSVTYDGKALPFALVSRQVAEDTLAGRVSDLDGKYIFSIPNDVTYFSRCVTDDGNFIRGVLALLGETSERGSKRYALISSTVDWNFYANRATNELKVPS